MSYHLLSSILSEGKRSNLSQLSPELFFENEEKAYKFILEHVKKYNLLPDVNTVRQNGFNIPDPIESFEYQLDKSKERYIRNLLNSALSPDNVNNMLQGNPVQFVQVLDDLRRQASRVYKSEEVSDILSGTSDIEQFILNAMAGQSMGISTGSESFDDLTHGFKAGDFVVFFARPGVGKTYLLLALCAVAMKQGKKVLFINNEMSDMELKQRFWAMEMGVNPDFMYSGQITSEQIHKMKLARSAYEAILANLIVINPTERMSIEQIKDYVADIQPDMLCVDSAYKNKPGDSNTRRTEYDSLNVVIAGFKDIAKHMNIPVLVTTQANRESTAKKEVSTAAAAGSDAWSQDATLMLHLDRHEIDDTKLIGTIVKNRGGRSFVNGKAIKVSINKDDVTMNYGIGDILEDFSEGYQGEVTF